ncbi:unnamed protein product [Parajaminaea phylloscopi]
MADGFAGGSGGRLHEAPRATSTPKTGRRVDTDRHPGHTRDDEGQVRDAEGADDEGQSTRHHRQMAGPISPSGPSHPSPPASSRPKSQPRAHGNPASADEPAGGPGRGGHGPATATGSSQATSPKQSADANAQSQQTAPPRSILRFPLPILAPPTHFPPLIDDHLAVLQPEYTQPFRGATDVVRRLLPWHLWQIPDDVVTLARLRARQGRHARASKEATASAPSRKRRKCSNTLEADIEPMDCYVPCVETSGRPTVARFEEIEGLTFPTETELDSILSRYQDIRRRVRNLRHSGLGGATTDTISDTGSQNSSSSDVAAAPFAQEGHLQLLNLSFHDERMQLETALSELKQARLDFIAEHGNQWHSELERVAPGATVPALPSITLPRRQSTPPPPAPPQHPQPHPLAHPPSVAQAQSHMNSPSQAHQSSQLQQQSGSVRPVRPREPSQSQASPRSMPRQSNGAQKSTSGPNVNVPGGTQPRSTPKPTAAKTAAASKDLGSTKAELTHNALSNARPDAPRPHLAGSPSLPASPSTTSRLGQSPRAPPAASPVAQSSKPLPHSAPGQASSPIVPVHPRPRSVGSSTMNSPSPQPTNPAAAAAVVSAKATAAVMATSSAAGAVDKAASAHSSPIVNTATGVPPNTAIAQQAPIRIILPLSLISKLTSAGIAPLPAKHLQPAIDAHKRRTAQQGSGTGNNPDPAAGYSTTPCDPDPNQTDAAILLGITEAPAPPAGHTNGKPAAGGERHQLVHISVVLNRLNPAQLNALAEAVNLVQQGGTSVGSAASAQRGRSAPSTAAAGKGQAANSSPDSAASTSDALALPKKSVANASKHVNQSDLSQQNQHGNNSVAPGHAVERKS